MIDLGKIAGFDWDSGNSRESADKHDASQSEAEQLFVNAPLLLLPDDKHDRLKSLAAHRKVSVNKLMVSPG